jgi:hypothetical protein
VDNNKFKRKYVNPFPDTLISWLDGFCIELDAERPRPPVENDKYYTWEEYYKRIGAWETQQIVRKRLLNAITVEKRKTERK